MAKLETTLHGNFSEILRAIDSAVLDGSFTASLEEESRFQSSSSRPSRSSITSRQPSMRK